MTEASKPPRWKPQAEIDPEITAEWELSETERAILGALLGAGKIRQAAQLVPVADSTARNVMCQLRQRLQQGGIVGLDCNDTDAMVRAYLAAERRGENG